MADDYLINPDEFKNDKDSGESLADYAEDNYRYCPERKSWMYYEDGRWLKDIDGLKIAEKAKQLSTELYIYLPRNSDDTDEYRKMINKICDNWNRRKNRETYIKEAQSVHPVSASEFDKQPHLINCLNGTLNLENMKLLPHNPEHFLTKLAPVNFNPSAKSEVFEKFLDDVTEGNNELKAFVQKCFGYCVCGYKSEESLFILYGATTRNGKSTLCEAVRNALGDYAATVNPETLSQRKNSDGSRPSEDIARLQGKRFVSVGEPSEGMIFDAARVKALTGNDCITARYLHEGSFEFSPEFSIYIHTNWLPQVSDMTLFESGRIVVIPFNRHFNEDEQDKSLKRKLNSREAKEAIFAWLIEGYQLYLKEGLQLPDVVENEIKEYREDSDKLGKFIEEQLIYASGSEVSTSACHNKYSQWCRDNDLYPEGLTKFNAKLRHRGIQIERKRPAGGGGNPSTFILNYRFNDETYWQQNDQDFDF